MDYKKMTFRSTNFIMLHGLLFIYDFRWNIDEINGFLKVWPFMAFYGLLWPSLAFLAFVALDEFFKQKLAFADKN